MIDKHQVWIGVVGKGPDGTMLSSSYENRFKPQYQSSLGNAVGKRLVPRFKVLLDKCQSIIICQLHLLKNVNLHTSVFIKCVLKVFFCLRKC